LTIASTKKVANLLGLRTALGFSRGSAGLYALLSAIARQQGSGEVIVPTLCCETVALAAIYAGHSVRFADVSPLTLCVTPQTVDALISARTRAVVIVHLYGIDAQAGAFNALRLRYPGIAFVEDIAHAFGGYGEDGRLLGASLDYTLASFADSKIIPGEGGMLLFGAGRLQPASVSSELSSDMPRVAKPRLALSLRNLVHALADLWREEAGRRGPPIFPEMLDRYKSLIVAPGNIANQDAVIDALEKLTENREARYKKYRLYRDGISSRGVTVPYLHGGSTCWRCPVVFESASAASTVTESLRALGIPASNHYFPLSVLFGAPSCPDGEDVALRIVNLWVDERMPSDTIQKTLDIINRI
jgi:dTDP-4-amino-4,6-dideoxygalactose transaminase